jgi:hypothetical protein
METHPAHGAKKPKSGNPAEIHVSKPESGITPKPTPKSAEAFLRSHQTRNNPDKSF